MLPNGLELSCPTEAGKVPLIVAHAGGPGAPPYAPARRVSFSELLGGQLRHDDDGEYAALRDRRGSPPSSSARCGADAAYANSCPGRLFPISIVPSSISAAAADPAYSHTPQSTQDCLAGPDMATNRPQPTARHNAPT